MGLFKTFSVTFEFQRPSVAGTRHFDTNGTPTQSPKSFTSTRDFNHPSLRYVISTIRHFDKKTPKTDGFLSLWRIVEMTGQSDEWSKSGVVVTDGGSDVPKWRILGSEW